LELTPQIKNVMKLLFKITLYFAFFILFGFTIAYLKNSLEKEQKFINLNIESTYTPVDLEHTISGDTIVIFVQDSLKYKYYIIQVYTNK